MSSKVRKRILVMFGSRFPSNTAPSARLSNLAAKLVEAGYAVTVVSSIESVRSKLHPQPAPLGINECRILPILLMIPFSHVLANVHNVVSSFVLSIIASFTHFDLVIFSVPPFDGPLGFHFGMSFFQVFRSRKSKFVYDYRDDILDLSVHKRNMRGIYAIDRYLLKPLLIATAVLLRKSDAIVCTTEEHRRLLLERGFDAQKVRVIHNGVDVKLFRFVDESERQRFRSKYELPQDSFVLVIVTGAGWLKYRVDLLLKALKRIEQRPDMNLTLVAIGRWTRELRAYLSLATKLRVNMRYIGEVAHSEMFEVLNAADIGVIPCGNYSSLRYILPVKLYEYCSCGLPVLITAPSNSLMERTVNEHSLGSVCQPHDTRSIADAIERFYFDRKSREEIGRHCRNVMEKEYDRRVLSEEYRSVLEEILADRKASGSNRT